MQTSGAISDFPGLAGCAPALDIESVIRQVNTVSEAQALPEGSIVGDLHGGLTFSDAVATALETRSAEGWREVRSPGGDIWTIIILNG